MPALSDPSETRLVPMTQSQRAFFQKMLWGHKLAPEWHAKVATEMRDAWDAAPADPAEALRQALAGWISGDPKVDLTDFSDDLDEVVTGVLAALGCVVERPEETT